ASEVLKQLQKPVDIYFDNRNLYILDAGKSAVIICDKQGRYKSSFTTSGAPEAEFKNPVSICVNYIGTIYVLDTSRSQVLSMTGEGLFLNSYSCDNPLSISLGIDQKLRVLTYSNNQYRVDVLTPDLKLIKPLILGLPDAKKGDINEIAVNDFNEIYVVNSSQCRIYKVNDLGKPIADFTFGNKGRTSGNAQFGLAGKINAYYEKGKQIVAVADYEFRNVQFFDDKSFNKTKKLEQPDWILKTALLPDDKVPAFIDHLVSDTLRFFIRDNASNSNEKRILTCETPTGVLYQITTNAKNKKMLSFDGLTIIGDSLFVTDSEKGCIHIFDRLAGSYIEPPIGEKGSRDGQLKNPQGIAADSDGLLYICDTDNNRISVFTRNGIFKPTFGTKPNDIIRPGRIVHFGNKTFYILCDNKNVFEWKAGESRPFKLQTPAKISSIEKVLGNYLAVADDTEQKVYLYQNKQEITRFGSASQRHNQSFFKKINALTFNPAENVLYVSDSGNNKSYKVKFYLPPLTPQNVKLVLSPENNSTPQRYTNLTWDATGYTRTWKIYGYSEIDTVEFFVDSNQYTIKDLKSEVYTYRVAAVSDDYRYSSLSLPIKDEYSNAMYLERNGSFLSAAE
ncbi:MAG: hypothetical protein FJ041_07670, partial [Candidatus Cloacimonetes bacterium]|nr:hypothetical protein [Candidatus Cloacimonadota bacterium]